MPRNPLNKRQWRIAALLATLLTVATVAIFLRPSQPVAAPSSLNPTIHAMRQDATPWLQHEREASYLFSALDQQKVATVGLTADAVLVSMPTTASTTSPTRMAC
ncbi:MAG: hypothetical protein JWM78_3605 [Verrucomicrobiaceae bacterium]|nr:hypothetical protein [Verrucomicrobiaceae bacterium]